MTTEQTAELDRMIANLEHQRRNHQPPQGITCECGDPSPTWNVDSHGSREFCCVGCWSHFQGITGGRWLQTFNY